MLDGVVIGKTGDDFERVSNAQVYAEWCERTYPEWKIDSGHGHDLKEDGSSHNILDKVLEDADNDDELYVTVKKIKSDPPFRYNTYPKWSHYTV